MQLAENNNLPSFNLSLVEAMDDRAYTTEIITDFLIETPKELEMMRTAFTSKDTETVAKKAHKLKSSVAIIEAVVLMAVFTDIETVAKSINQEKLQGLLNDANQEFFLLE